MAVGWLQPWKIVIAPTHRYGDGLGIVFTAERFYELVLNRVVEPEKLIPTALEMAEHLLTLPQPHA